jgi:uncharacterized protein YcbX
MGPEPLDTAELHWTWMHGDRQYAFIRAGNTSDFPWLTARDLPNLVRFRACYVNPVDPRHSKLIVTDPEGVEFDIRDPRLAARLADEAGTPVWLLRLGRGGFDAMPISILTTTTAAAIEREHGAPVSVGRFRANIVIRPDDLAVTEQNWIGRSLQFGVGPNAVRLHVDWATPRCAMVGIDPTSGERDPSIVRTVAQRFQNRVGAYCAIKAPGTIRVGDRVTRDPVRGLLE